MKRIQKGQWHLTLGADKQLSLAIYCKCGQHLRGNKHKPASIVECGTCHSQFTVPESTEGLRVTTCRKFFKSLNVGLPDKLFETEGRK